MWIDIKTNTPDVQAHRDYTFILYSREVLVTDGKSIKIARYVIDEFGKSKGFKTDVIGMPVTGIIKWSNDFPLLPDGSKFQG